MSGVVPWAIESLVASTVLMVLVLMLRTRVRRLFGPDIAYALWLLPALRLILPPLPAQWHQSVAAPVARATDQLAVMVTQPLAIEPAANTAVVHAATVAPAATSTASIMPAFHLALLAPALVLLWVIGAAGFMMFHSISHARFCRRMLECSDGDEAIADGVHVIETSAARGPLAFGIWRRYVAFPRDFAERYDADERDLALAHELGHHARGDLIANWAALAVLAVHWFNPIAWRAFRAFRADQEIANDARVLAGRDAVTRHLYACAIVKAAHGGAVSAACHLHTIEDLKGRLRMLSTSRMSRRRLASGAGVLALVGAMGLGLTASGTQAAERVRDKVEKATGVHLAKLTLPAAFQSMPEVPDAPEAPDAPVLPTGGHHYKMVLIDGNKTVIERDLGEDGVPSIPHVPPVPNVPQVSNRNCGDPTNHQMVIYDQANGQKRIFICSDRIAAMSRGPQVINAPCGNVGGNRQMVIHDEANGQKRVIVCSDRIEAMSNNAERMAERGEREAERSERDAERSARQAEKSQEMAAKAVEIQRAAYTKALTKLQERRESIAEDMAESDIGRKEALKGYDEAIRNLERNLAAVD